MKAFEVKRNNTAMTARYAFMSMMADATCSAMLLGTISFHTSTDKLAVLIILYNILSISLRTLFAVFADNVTNKHTGVRMAVLIIVMGFIYPVSFGVTIKTVLMGVGNAAFHAFASSSVLLKSENKICGMGLYTAGSIIGLGLAEFIHIFGYFSVSFLMMGATPSDKSEKVNEICSDKEEKASEKRLSLVFVLLILVCIFVGNYINNSVKFEWNTGRNTALFICLAAGIGRIMGGALYRFFPIIIQVVSLAAGGFLFVFAGKSVPMSLFGIMLINMSVPIFIGRIYRLMPDSPAMCHALASASAYFGVLIINICPIDTALLRILFVAILLLVVMVTVFDEVIFGKKQELYSKFFGGKND